MTDTTRGRRRRTSVLVIVGLLAVASCGDDDDASTGRTPPTSPSTSAPAATASAKPTTMPPSTVATTIGTTAEPSTTTSSQPPATTVAAVASSVPAAAPALQPVLTDGWCSQALVDFMIDQSTASTFEPGFAVAGVDSGLDVGCSGTSPEVSVPGYIDTFTVVHNGPGVIDVVADRIRAAGYVDDPLADPAHPMFQTPGGDPIAFVTPLDLKSEMGGGDVGFQDASQWVVVQFYLPGG